MSGCGGDPDEESLGEGEQALGGESAAPHARSSILVMESNDPPEVRNKPRIDVPSTDAQRDVERA